MTKAAFIVIDLETLSLSIKDAPIISLGGYLMGVIESDLNVRNNNVDFWSQNNFELKHTFHEICNYKAQQIDGRVPSKSTLDWWQEVGGDAVELLKQSENSNQYLPDVLHSFDYWLNDIQSQCDEIYILGNGAAFDNALLEIAYFDNFIERPWKYTNSLCLRTLYSIFNPDLVSLQAFTEEDCKNYLKTQSEGFVIASEGSFIKHNALHDAMFQGHKAKLMFPNSMWLAILNNTHRKPKP